MSIIRPPITGDPQLDSWTDMLTRRINQGSLPGAIGGGGSGGGGSGKDGVNGDSAIYLYQRTNSGTSAPTRPSNVSYDLDKGVSETKDNSPGNNKWSSTPEAATTTKQYLWVTFRYISSRSGTITDKDSWDTPVLLGQPGADAITVEISIRERPTTAAISSGPPASFDGGNKHSSTIDPTSWPYLDQGSAFREFVTGSSSPAVKEKTLVATVFRGGTALTMEQHRSLSYGWQIGNTTYTPDETGASGNSRWVPVNADDVLVSAGFICNVGNIQE